MLLGVGGFIIRITPLSQVHTLHVCAACVAAFLVVLLFRLLATPPLVSFGNPHDLDRAGSVGEYVCGTFNGPCREYFSRCVTQPTRLPRSTSKTHLRLRWIDPRAFSNNSVSLKLTGLIHLNINVALYVEVGNIPPATKPQLAQVISNSRKHSNATLLKLGFPAQ